MTDYVQGYVIQRLDLDGSNSLLLYHNTHVTINVVTLDYDKQNVYWIEMDNESKQKRIRFTNVNGTGVENFEIKNSSSNGDYHTKHLAVDKHYVYYVVKLSDGFDHLQRANKVNGNFDVDFDVF